MTKSVIFDMLDACSIRSHQFYSIFKNFFAISSFYPEDTKSITSLSIVRHPPEVTDATTTTMKRGKKKEKGKGAPSAPISNPSAVEQDYGWVRDLSKRRKVFFIPICLCVHENFSFFSQTYSKKDFTVCEEV